MAESLNLDLDRRVSGVSVKASSAGPGEQPGQVAGQTPDNHQISQQMEIERNQVRTALASLNRAAEELSQFRQKMLQDVEGQLLELATSIAKKVLMQEIQAGRYDIEPIVKEALCHVPARQDLVIRLNPQDYAQCEMVRQDSQAGQQAGACQIRFIADPSVPPAECVVESSEGVIQSSLDAHLQEVGELLKAPD